MTSRTLRYRFAELSIVTSDTLEQTVNEWVAQGWQLDGIRFVMTEASRRPCMAFVSFVREEDAPAPAPVAELSAPASPSRSTRRRRH